MIEMRGDELILSVKKVFDANCVESLTEQIGPYVNQPWQRLVVDVFSTQVITSAGLQFLDELHHSAASAGRQLMLIGCNESVLARVRLFRLDHLFTVGINKSSKELNSGS